MTHHTVLIAGASGLIGSHLLTHFDKQEDYRAIGLSRHKPSHSQLHYLEADLNDFDLLISKLKTISSINTVIFTAYNNQAIHSPLHISNNTKSLENLVKAMELTQPDFENMILIQGAKVYGAHLGPFKTPAKETDPRHFPYNFYYAQEDFLQEYQRGKSWTWRILRPDLVTGYHDGNGMNIVKSIYTLVNKTIKSNLPLRFPGSLGAYNSLVQSTNANLLPQACEWLLINKHTEFEAFNITNGDCFRWKYLWQSIAKHFNLTIADPLPLSLSTIIEKTPEWVFADMVFHSDYDILCDITKIRQYGFNPCIDSEVNFIEHLEQYHAGQQNCRTN